MQAEILTGITDVTAKVTGAGAGQTGTALVKARVAAASVLEHDGCPDQASGEGFGCGQGLAARRQRVDDGDGSRIRNRHPCPWRGRPHAGVPRPGCT